MPRGLRANDSASPPQRRLNDRGSAASSPQLTGVFEKPLVGRAESNRPDDQRKPEKGKDDPSDNQRSAQRFDRHSFPRRHLSQGTNARGIPRDRSRTGNTLVVLLLSKTN